ncbi:MAG TPA: HlyD family efflux transporter periplasmic adaptor subunit [Saprospiraceae bacterium]|nr:HlyD family efflux transporter periplasmic adaptor subunit [Saprospiraceae bacterium]
MKNHLSEEILDILNEPPRWLVRMGATVFALLLAMLLTSTWFIKSPEVLKGSAIITTSSPAIRVVAEREGRIMRLLVSNDTEVRKGEVLAEMENQTKLENMPQLLDLLHQTRSFLKNQHQKIELPDESLTWGDLQEDVHLLVQNYTDLRQLQSDGFHTGQIQNLKVQMSALRQLQQVQARKKDLSSEELKNASKHYFTDQKLFEDGFYSRIDFLKKENDYLAQKREAESYSENLIRGELKLAEMEQELQQIGYSYEQKKRLAMDNIRQAAQNIENGIRYWQQNYLIKAPSDGKLTYLKSLTENQYVPSGDTLFAVMPAHHNYLALVEAPAKGMGKSAVGQKVVLKLDDYPFQEFGTVEGRVLSMTPSSDVKTYRLTVALPKGLHSSYSRNLTYNSELVGTAEVITEDIRLFERAFYGIRKLLM